MSASSIADAFHMHPALLVEGSGVSFVSQKWQPVPLHPLAHSRHHHHLQSHHPLNQMDHPPHHQHQMKLACLGPPRAQYTDQQPLKAIRLSVASSVPPSAHWE